MVPEPAELDLNSRGSWYIIYPQYTNILILIFSENFFPKHPCCMDFFRVHLQGNDSWFTHIIIVPKHLRRHTYVDIYSHGQKYRHSNHVWMFKSISRKREIIFIYVKRQRRTIISWYLKCVKKYTEKRHRNSTFS